MQAFWIIGGILGFFYSFLILSFYYGWIKTKKFIPKVYSGTTFVSVIIAVRNEESNISDLLSDIIAQDFPKENYEIIVIDDHSTDKTSVLVKEFYRKTNIIHFLKLTDPFFGKKYAIQKGIHHARGNLIVTTDADCRMKNKWLLTIVSFYETKKSKMIVGPVLINSGERIFAQMQSLEFLSLVGAGAGAIGIHKPIMCNGANLAYEREIFLENSDDLLTKFASGDDVLFMLKLKKRFRNDISFLKSMEATVFSKAQFSLYDFYQQRKRWISKSRAYNDLDVILTAILVFIINFFLLFSFFGIFVNPFFTGIFISLFILKTIVDFVLLYSVSLFFNRKKWLRFFIPLQFIYIFYVSFITIPGNLGSFKWKGRGFKK